jgi:beta-phosphoglucomutase-like phosphatase (HAD superfamily)
MITFSQVRGAVFDVDDTIFDNDKQSIYGGHHENARLLAIQKIGEDQDIGEFRNLSIEANRDAFRNNAVHSFEAAVWTILTDCKLVDSPTIDPHNPLLKQITELKDEFYLDLIRRKGKEIVGASTFVRAMAAHTDGRIAIASTAIKRDLTEVLNIVGLTDVFAPDRIFSKESVSHPKPHPEGFNKAFLSLELPEKDRANVLAFEDDPRGIEAAKAAGLTVCAIATRYSVEELRNQPEERRAHIFGTTFADLSEQLGMTR